MAAHEGQLGRLVVRAYLVALAVTLGGCSASEVVQNLPPAGALDRFGTRLEHRMTQAEIKVLMENAGLGEIRFRDGVPFWCAIGRKI